MSTSNNTKTDYRFEGWHGFNQDACEGHMKFQEFEPKVWDEDDVDVKVLYCGICASDASLLAGEWGPVPEKGQVCGHEIVGEVVRTGSKVEGGLKVGDIVGIGAQFDSCLECEWCTSDQENLCAKVVSAPIPPVSFFSMA